MTDSALRLAEYYFRLNQTELSKPILYEYLKTNSNSSLAHELYAYILSRENKPFECLKHLQLACSLKNPSDTAHYYLGSALLKNNELQLAEHHLNIAVQKNDGFFEAQNDLGITQFQLGKIHESIDTYLSALNINPKSAQTHYNLAISYEGLNSPNEALKHYQCCLQLDASNFLAHNNLGLILKDQGLYEKALAHFQAAFEAKPSYSEALVNIGSMFNEMSRFTEALHFFDEALKITIGNSDLLYNKSIALTHLKRHSEALDCINTAFALNPETEYIIGALLNLKMYLGDWSDVDSLVNTTETSVLKNKRCITPFSTIAVTDKPDVIYSSSKIFSEHKFPGLSESIWAPPHTNAKIRIAYLSSDFNDHPVGYLTAGLIENHNREIFDVLGFSTAVNPPNSLTRDRFKASFDQFIDLQNKTDEEAMLLIRKLNIDILINLNGHTSTTPRTGIFSRRAAPIQINFLGFAGTMGSTYMDYIIADRIVIPKENIKFYSEKICFLPNSYMLDDPKRLRSDNEFTRKDFGLPENAFIFSCFNNSYKINPKVIAAWCRILHQSPHSVLWLANHNTSFKINFLKLTAELGIESDRIIFASRVDKMSDHLARLSLADLFLDTYPYNAHTTGIDSLKAGVPVLSILGKSFASRVGASLLNAVGMPKLVVRNENEYIEFATSLYLDPEKIKSIRSELKHKLSTSPLFNLGLFTMHIESAYQQMYDRVTKKLTPINIYI